MSEKEERHERPCLHCLIVELIDEFFAEYPATSGASDNVDTDEADEVIDAIAKPVAGANLPARCHDPPATDRTPNA
jgi:hypothetical protein